MGNVVKFEAHGKEYQLSLMERDGNKWVTAQQVGEAMGLKNIRKLIKELKESNEIWEGKHFCNVTLQKKTRGNPNALMLSCHGVIRVAMRAQGARAKLFRDWAEDVLYDVMMTGTYGVQWPDQDQTDALLERARKDAMLRGMALANVLREFQERYVAKAVHFRRMGLSQRETAGALGITRDRVQRLERALADVGIRFDAINANHRDKVIRESLVDNLLEGPMALEGGAS